MSDRLRWEADQEDHREVARTLAQTLKRVRALEAEAAALRMENAVLRERWPEHESLGEWPQAA